MPYADTYCAFIKYADGSTEEWTNLRKTQAKWRYHWLGRNYYRLRDRDPKEWGWRREWLPEIRHSKINTTY